MKGEGQRAETADEGVENLKEGWLRSVHVMGVGTHADKVFGGSSAKMGSQKAGKEIRRKKGNGALLSSSNTEETHRNKKVPGRGNALGRINYKESPGETSLENSGCGEK